jgi:hypothetical protein
MVFSKDIHQLEILVKGLLLILEVEDFLIEFLSVQNTEVGDVYKKREKYLNIRWEGQ